MRLIDADDILYTKDDSGLRDFDYAIRAQLENLPTIDPVKHGHWHDVYMLSQQTIAQTCSCCSNSVVRSIANVFHYCPSCGAKMDL